MKRQTKVLASASTTAAEYIARVAIGMSGLTAVVGILLLASPSTASTFVDPTPTPVAPNAYCDTGDWQFSSGAIRCFNWEGQAFDDPEDDQSCRYWRSYDYVPTDDYYDSYAIPLLPDTDITVSAMEVFVHLLSSADPLPSQDGVEFYLEVYRKTGTDTDDGEYPWVNGFEWDRYEFVQRSRNMAPGAYSITGTDDYFTGEVPPPNRAIFDPPLTLDADEEYLVGVYFYDWAHDWLVRFEYLWNDEGWGAYNGSWYDNCEVPSFAYGQPDGFWTNELHLCSPSGPDYNLDWCVPYSKLRNTYALGTLVDGTICDPPTDANECYIPMYTGIALYGPTRPFGVYIVEVLASQGPTPTPTP